MTARPSTPPLGGGRSSAGGVAAPAASQRKPYYSSQEVAEHNVMSDCWISYFGNVYNLTKLIQENKGAAAAETEAAMHIRRGGGSSSLPANAQPRVFAALSIHSHLL